MIKKKEIIQYEILEHYEKALKRVWEIYSNKVNNEFDYDERKNKQVNFHLG